jgi:RecA/RadA recombinase
LNFINVNENNKIQLLKKLNERQQKYVAAHVDRIVHDFSSLCLPRPVMDCYSLLHRTREMPNTLSLGSEVLDFALNGGFRTRCISEIAGESSAGKTQMCMQLLVQTVLPRRLGGLEGHALYITSETYPQERLFQLAEHKIKQIKKCLQQHKTRISNRDIDDMREDEDLDDKTIALLEEFQNVKDITDRIKITKVKDHEQFYNVIVETLPNVCRLYGNIRCIIIDSIAALFRGELEFQSREGLQKRTQFLFSVANQLKILADLHNAAVIVVNQVTTIIRDIPISVKPFSVREDYISPVTAVESRLYMWGPLDEDEDDARCLIRTAQIMNKKIAPSLGISWSNCVNVSIMLTRTEIPIHVRTRQDGSKRVRLSNKEVLYLANEGDQALEEREVSRQMHVIFAPYVKSNSVTYVVREAGVEGIAT